ncbi:MAG: hypothetical protein F9K30_05710 [Dechloromonas sp.]|nr:MAG: hypothetical protein F9K30_05710 [Dechloromonas sp.]
MPLGLVGASGNDREFDSRFLFRRLDDGLFFFDTLSGETFLLPPDMQSCSQFLESCLSGDAIAVAHWQSELRRSGLVED